MCIHPPIYTASEGCFSDVRDHLGPQILQQVKKEFVRKLFTLLGHLFKQSHFFNFIYTVKDTESEYHIQNISL